MPHPDPVGEHADALAFLRDRLDRGNACLGTGNARGAIVWYESALQGFRAGNAVEVLRETYRALWNNKAIAHEQLREFVQSQEAAIYATRLAAGR